MENKQDEASAAVEEKPTEQCEAAEQVPEEGETEQEVAYSAAQQAANEDGEVDLGTLGDRMIDTVSVETNVETVSRGFKMPESVAKYVMGIVYILLGAVCAAIPHRIESVLPYVVGGILGVFSIMRFIFAIMDKEYLRSDTNRTVSSLIMLGVCIMIIIEHEWAHTFIPMIWGVWGLIEGAHAFNHAIARIAKHRSFIYFVIKGIAEVVVAFLLLYEPHQYGVVHIIVFGVSLILDGLVTLPFIHKFVTRG